MNKKKEKEIRKLVGRNFQKYVESEEYQKEYDKRYKQLLKKIVKLIKDAKKKGVKFEEAEE